ncbi:hypothetical protein, partial [Cetobacterium sp.]|uniref:hypothetical protein n=1 Tax=Cetobacterium sp. TaxID=2071632 RepID=UPI003F3DF962
EEETEDISKGIIGTLSFDSKDEVIEKEQKKLNGSELKVYLTIEKDEVMKLREGLNYKILGYYNKGRISETEVLNKDLAYIGLKTDHTSDLGFDEYIYDSIFTLNVKSTIEKDTRVRLNLFEQGETLPIPKSKTGTDNLMRVYLDEAKYSIDVVGHVNYGKLNMSGLQLPFEYDRKFFENPHKMRVVDKLSGVSVENTIENKGGYVTIDTSFGKLSLGYTDRLSIKEDFLARDSREILTVGLLEYKFKGGNLPLEIEHYEDGNSIPVIKGELIIRFPEFEPIKWYYNEKNNDKIQRTVTSSIQYFNEKELIFPIGEVGLNPYRDKEITVTSSDEKGVRIEYDDEIWFVESGNPNNKVKGKIVEIKGEGEVQTKDFIQSEKARLAVIIDDSNTNYDEHKTYIYRDGQYGVVDDKITGKPIRIGRNGHWESLVESIELTPVKLGGLHTFDWTSGIVNITDWKKTKKNKGFNIVQDVIYGQESYDAKTIPYIDIYLGKISIFRSELANTISLDHTSNVDRRGTIILQTPEGNRITGKLYLKPSVAEITDKIPVKDYYNNDIPGATLKIKFQDGEEKSSDVRLRLYDSEINGKSLFTEGILEYLDGLYSNNRTFNISIEENGIKNIVASNNEIPNIELINLNDKLKEEIYLNKKILNFTLASGRNIEEEIVWVLGDKYVDMRLLSFNMLNYLDKTMKIKNPYIKIDTVDIPTYDVNGKSEAPYRYYLDLKAGDISSTDEIIEDEKNTVIGYTKISSISDNGNVGNLNVDLKLRLKAEQYEELKNDISKVFKLKKKDGESAELEIVFNEDYPEQSVKVPYGDFKTIKEESDREGNTVDLKTL